MASALEPREAVSAVQGVRRADGAAAPARETGAGPGAIGLGVALPDRVVPNAEITRDRRRRRLDRAPHRHPRAPLRGARRAARRARRRGRRAALADAGIDAAELDLVLVASCSQDSVMPAASPPVAHALGARRAAFDVGSACTGFLAALAAARAMPLRRRRRALVIGAEIMSRHVDPSDRNTAALFGDGAGAIVLGGARPAASGRSCSAPTARTRS